MFKLWQNIKNRIIGVRIIKLEKKFIVQRLKDNSWVGIDKESNTCFWFGIEAQVTNCGFDSLEEAHTAYHGYLDYVVDQEIQLIESPKSLPKFWRILKEKWRQFQ